MTDPTADLDQTLAGIQAQIDELKAVDRDLQTQIDTLNTAAPITDHRLPYWGDPVWLEEFDKGLEEWDIYLGNLSYDLATCKAENVAIRAGELVITSKKEAGSSGRAYTTGYVQTKKAWKYGRFEARMKINTVAAESAGVWPAFWARPKNGEVTGEIDIMEAWGEPSTTRTDYRKGDATYTLHQNTSGTQKKKGGWYYQGEAENGGERLSDDYHDYAIEWTPDGFKVLVDNVVVKWGDIPNSALGFPADVFNAPFELRIQTQIGQPSYWGVPDANTKMPTEFLTKWVRVYALPA
jgi:beta-glucanase (GH16 family)